MPNSPATIGHRANLVIAMDGGVRRAAMVRVGDRAGAVAVAAVRIAVRVMIAPAVRAAKVSVVRNAQVRVRPAAIVARAVMAGGMTAVTTVSSGANR